MWYLYGLALVAGIANAVQGGTNATLAKTLGQPFAAGLVVALGTGTTLLLVGLVSGRLSLPSLAAAAQVPAWAWFGGCLGALVVLSQFFAAQQIGAAPFLAILVTAGVATSILLDHFGWIGFSVHAASPWRIVGGLLMVAGVTLVALF
ncbi:DMT family transporter [Methylobacterium sp. J-090]|uniref:DMT family transporter n=1 Tax=Methylobacterium sp. J-090 TaxID=2836666 RepID=UPI001FBA29C1|nr:DMT family transporter [Methylobacterium sp. J-090]MCJ2081631.1 DMT family transporter [Methylobacterium sp. J-090]